MKTSSRRLISLWLAILFLASTVSGQTLAKARPPEAGLAVDRLNRIGSLVQSYVDRNQIAGAVTLVARRGKVAHLEATGMADIAAKTPMRPDTIFRIASMTKPVTSVAVMMLYEEGRILLAEPISKYIPEFQNAQVLVPSSAQDGSGEPYKLVPAKRPITIRHLLTHTSGITYRFIGRPHVSLLYKSGGVSDGLTQIEGTLEAMVKRIAAQPLVNHPGESWEYGLSTDVLGRLVEVVSGMTLDQFFRERIFKPLGMKDTHFFLPQEKVARLASVYRPASKGGIEKLPETPVEMGPLVFSTSFHYSGPRTYFSGGAGLVSTATDYARFLQMLLGGGTLDGVRLLSRKTVEIMTVNHTSGTNLFPGTEGYGFGLGFAVNTDLGKTGRIGSMGEYNWGGFFATRFWIDPKEDMIGIIMLQMYPNNHLDLGEKFRVLAYQAIVD
jgi:CubicO group peptidase (beta-lactamase class C family)